MPGMEDATVTDSFAAPHRTACAPRSPMLYKINKG